MTNKKRESEWQMAPGWWILPAALLGICAWGALIWWVLQ